MATGTFITFEGGEGSGKSTQARLLAEWLARRGMPTLTTREPGGTAFAEEIRNLILFGAVSTSPGTALAEALLFYAARADHVERRIAPALAAGTSVICDRFSDSTRAYQGAAGGVPAEQLAAIERAVLGALRPDLTFILDLPATAGLARAEARRLREQRPSESPSERDGFEQRTLDFHERLRHGFLAIAAAEPARCQVLDAQAGIDEIAARVQAAVAAHLGSR